MLGVRSLGLALVLGWHVLAGGMGSLLHTCSMSESTAAACKCRHAQQSAGDDDQVRRADCCKEELVRAVVAPAVRDSSRAVEVAFAPSLPLHALAAVDATVLPSQVLAWRTSAPSQGPPVFLKIRTLLI